MARRLGPYAPLSATYSSDDAIIEAEEKAELLYVRGLAFCAASESDGFITRAQLKRFVGAGMDDVMERAARLVEVGLWEEEGGGFVVRAWLKWNASTEELGRARRKDRERKATKKVEPFRAEDGSESGAEQESEDDEDSGDHSERNPSGIQTEDETESGSDSAGSPDGFQPRVDARTSARVEARAPNSLNSTSLNKDSPSPQGGAPGIRRAESDLKFAKFWAVYPRRVGKSDARKSWDKAIKDGVDPDAIILGAENYLKDPIRRTAELKFTAHPSTWLNHGRWTDEATQEQQGQPGGSGGWWDN